ncbi:SGNH/GDSL hydrolase family protein [Saccharopolyspora griseoalba]|uniref:SGNH/GDSL hydrolase family protein n=1 Tax=Saccharopolyspora griseoalba TaxID=1431848 RepID=A0ABW2LCT6_9PSEU
MSNARPAWVTQEITEKMLRGALEVERTGEGLLPQRLPGWVRQRGADAGVLLAASQPSGVRVALRTSASAIELDARRTTVAYTGAPSRPDGVYELLVDGRPVAHASVGGGNVVEIDMATGQRTEVPGEPGTAVFTGLGEGDKTVEIWLPHTETTELLGLRADAPVHPAAEPGLRRWVHHGSSISHGSNAAGPASTWPALAARRGGVELTNLGFSGSALLDPFTARAIRDAPAEVISLKIGINLVGGDLMRMRAFVPAVHGFLDTIREGHPEVPLLVISPIHCDIHERTPGPSAPDLTGGQVRFVATGDPAEISSGKIALETVRQALAGVVAERDDAQLHYLDGRELYGPGDAVELPLPDALHPDAATHRLMGERFAEHAFTPGGVFA